MIDCFAFFFRPSSLASFLIAIFFLKLLPRILEAVVEPKPLKLFMKSAMSNARTRTGHRGLRPVVQEPNQAVITPCGIQPEGTSADMDTVPVEFHPKVQQWICSHPSMSITEKLQAIWSLFLLSYNGGEGIQFQTIVDAAEPAWLAAKIDESSELESIVAGVQVQAASAVPLSAQVLGSYRNTILIITSAGGNDTAHSTSTPTSADLVFHVSTLAVRMKPSLTFRCDILSRLEAANMACQLSHIAAAVILYPWMKVKDIGVSKAHLEQIKTWNARPLPVCNHTIPDAFAAQVARGPERTAVVAVDQSLGYHDLDLMSNRLAQQLLSRAVEPETWVLLCFPKSAWAIIAMLGALKAGRACAMIDPSYPAQRVAAIAQQTGSSLALVAPIYADKLRSHGLDVMEVCSNSVNVASEQEPHPKPLVTPSQAAFAIFTSGSTGRPKGVVLEHGTMCLSAETLGDVFHVGPSTRILQFAAFTFDISLEDIFTGLLRGATIYMPDEDERLNFLSGYITRNRVNWANLTPTVARQLQPTALPTIKNLVLAGEPVTDRDVKPWVAAGVELHNGYGPTEATLCVANHQLGRQGRACNVGRGLHTIAFIVHRQHPERPVPLGAVGELLLAGPLLARGYLGDPQRTASSFVCVEDWQQYTCPMEDIQRVYRTGDLARYCADGSLEILGRADTQVKVGGQRIELEEIEHHIMNIQNIANVTVLVPTEGPLKGRLTVVVSRAEADGQVGTLTSMRFLRMTPEQTRGWQTAISESLPQYMVPSTWLQLEHMPLSLSGKVDRVTVRTAVNELTGDLLAGLLGTAPSPVRLVQTTEERRLLDICSQVLNVPPDGLALSQSFVAQGGDSINAMQVAALYHTQGRSLKIQYILANRPLSYLATIVQEQDQSPLYAVPEQVGVAFPLAPVQRLFFDVVDRSTSTVYNQYNQSMLLRLARPISQKDLARALDNIVRTHSMLRARFCRDAAGDWTQFISPDALNSFRFTCHSCDSHQKREQCMRTARASLDIENGPILRAELFEGDQNPHLFLVAHHILVDLVSWRVVINDLESLLVGAVDSLPKSLSFQVWNDQQALFAREALHPDRMTASALCPSSDYSFWSMKRERNTYGGVKRKSIKLDATATNNLLTGCHHTLQTEPIDVLLAALVLSFREHFPERTLPIFNEGHGREPWRDDLDISRTVGWFTTMAPIYLDPPPSGAMEAVIRVKDIRRQMGGNGWEYFTSRAFNPEGEKQFHGHFPVEVLFNYEGRYQSLYRKSSLFQLDRQTAGEALEDSHSDLARFSLFEIATAVLGDELVVAFDWHRDMAHQSRIEKVADQFVQTLKAVVSRLQEEPRQWTVSDLPLMHLHNRGVLALTKNVLDKACVSTLDDVDEVYPCTPIQEALVLSQAARPEVYKVDMLWQVKDQELPSRPVDLDRLQRSCHQVVHRHPMLRTVLVESVREDGVFDQVVLRHNHVDCWRQSIREDNLPQWLSQYREDPDWLQSPPVRFTLLTTDQGNTYVRLEINHVLFDGMSTLPLLHDLALAYGNLLPVGLGPSFCTFVRFLQDGSPSRDECLRYWSKYLETACPCHFPLLLDQESRDHKLGSTSIPLTTKLRELRALSSRENLTVATIFRLMWAMVLSSYTGSSRVSFGCLFAGRDAPIKDIDKAIGPFITMLPCYITLLKTTSLQEAMRRMHGELLDSLPYRSCSIADVQDSLGMGHGSLFNTAISFQDLLTDGGQQGWPLQFREVERKDPTEYDLTLIVETGEDEVNLSLSYWTSTISHAHAVNIASTVDHLLHQIVATPDRTIGDIDFLSSRDANTIWSWNREAPIAGHDLVHEIVQTQMRLHPKAPAIYSWDAQLTYEQLDERSGCLARFLVQQGIVPGDLVPLCFEKSAWAIVSMVGVLRAGGAFTMLDPSFPEERLRDIVRAVDAPMILSSAFTHSRCKSLHTRIFSITQEFFNLRMDEYASPPRVCVSPDHPMCVVFTSGTTGKPKGSVISHRAFTSQAQEHRASMQLTPESRVLQFSSYTFDVSIGDVFRSLETGSCVCSPAEEQRNMEIVNFIKSADVNYACLTPSFASLLDPRSVPSLRVLALAGEYVPGTLIKIWSGHVRILNLYGPSEATVTCIGHPDLTSQTLAGTIGRSFRGASWVVDPNDHERLLPIGAVGELLIEGPILADRYLKDPEKTRAAFIPSPAWLRESASFSRDTRLYKTGDLVRYCSDGNIVFIGRKDRQVKINGQRVELEEIEIHIREVLLSIDPRMTAAAEVLHRQSTDSPDILTAFVVIATGSDGEENDVLVKDHPLIESFRKHTARISEVLCQRLPRHMRPGLYLPVNSLPLTASGKLDRRALQGIMAGLQHDELMTYTSGVGEKQGPSTPNERMLCDLWRRILRDEFPDINDHFFHAGGNSITAIRLSAEVQRAGFRLSVAQIFESPVLREMAAVLDSGVMSNSSPVDVEPRQLLCHWKGTDEALEEAISSTGLRTNEIEDCFPSTPMQEAFMASSIDLGNSKPYLLNVHFKLPESLDCNRFREAWESVTTALPILRSRLIQTSQGGLIVIGTSPIPTERSKLSPAEFTARLDQQPFKYGQPLVRLALLAPDGDFDRAPWFAFCAHHVVYDAWSLGLIYKWVQATYQGQCVPPSVPYQAFIEELHRIPHAASDEYWRKRLIQQHTAHFPVPPAGHQPVASSCTTCCVENVGIPKGYTLNTMVLAAWAIVCAQYTLSEEVTFGVVSSGRNFPMPGIETVVGPTVSTTPQQWTVEPSQSLLAFLSTVQDDMAKSTNHQHVGLGRIGAVSAPARQACDFASLVVVQGEDAEPHPFSALDVMSAPVQSDDSLPYGVVLECRINGQNLSIDIRFDTQCLREGQVRHISYQLQHVLRLIGSASPTTTLLDLQSINPEDFDVQMQLCNTEMPPGHDRCIHHLIEEQAAQWPHATALSSSLRQITYQELNDLANNLAIQLQRTGHVGPNSFVGLCFRKSLTAIVCMLAIWKAGGAFFAMDPDHPQERLNMMVRQSQCGLVLTSGSLHSRFAASSCIVQGIEWESLDSGSIKSTLRSSGARDAAYMMFTSGSTGTPKGVVVEHGSLCSTMGTHGKCFELGRAERSLQFSAYTFDALFLDTFAMLVCGACVCVPTDDERFNGLTEFIQSQRVTTTFLTPQVFRLLDPNEVPTFQKVMVGGEPSQPADIDRWTAVPGKRLFNAYGPTECTVVCVAGELRSGAQARHLGWPIGCRAWVVNKHRTSLVPLGCPGELCVQGPNVARGYFEDEAKTRGVFINSPQWLPEGQCQRVYLTGDIVCMHEDGSLSFVGRKDAQVKLHGQRIEIGEIESILYSSAAELGTIRGGAVTLYDGRQGRRQASALVAVIVPDNPTPEPMVYWQDQSVSDHTQAELALVASRLMRYLRDRLPSIMVPPVIVSIPALPLSSSGKLNRRALRNYLQQVDQKHGLWRSGAVEDPSHSWTPRENALKGLWVTVLGCDDSMITPNSSFVELGGNSILAIRLAVCARSVSYQLSVRDILAHPRLKDMAATMITGNNQRRQDGPDPYGLIRPDQKKEILTVAGKLLSDAQSTEIEDIYPCTPMQEALMVSTSRHGMAYIGVHRFAMAPTTDANKLHNAWDAVFRQFSILRTRIVQTSAHGSLQIVLSPQRPEIPSYDYIQDYMDHINAHIGPGQPLIYLGFHENGSRRELLVAAHHAIYDGWSLPLLLQSVSDHYQGRCPKSFSTPYNHFVGALLRQDAAAAVDFWTRKLEGFESSHFPFKPSQDYQPRPTAALRRCTQIESAHSNSLMMSPTTIIQAAWALVLANYSGTTDIVFGAVLSGRNMADISGIDDVVGPTIATIPVRVRIDHNAQVAAWVRQVEEDAQTVQSVAHVGLSAISRIGPEGQKACAFNNILVVQPSSSTTDAALQEVGLTPLPTEVEAFHQYGLMVEVTIPSQPVAPFELSLSYDPVILPPEQACELVDGLVSTVSALVQTNPSSLLRDLCPIHLEEKAAIQNATAWCNSALCAERVVDSIEEQSILQASEPALCASDGVWSYGELNQRASRLSRRLRDAMVRVDQAQSAHVPILFEKSRDAIVAMLAIWKLGASFVPLDPSMPQERLGYILGKTKAQLVLTSPRHADKASRLGVTSLVVDSKSHTLPSVLCAQGPLCRSAVAGDTAYVLFTSGSTGAPKGVMVDHRALLASLRAQSQTFELSASTRMLQFCSFTFDVCLLEIFATMLSGGCVCIPSEDERMNDLAGFIRQHDVNTMACSPSTARLLAPPGIPSMETVILAGEPMVQSDIDQWSSIRRLYNAYGPTEATIICAAQRVGRGTKPNQIGHAVGAQLWVLHPSGYGPMTPVGGVGELYIDGPTVANGYLDDARSADVFIQSPSWMPGRRWYRTGDLVRRCLDGSLIYVGRKDHQVKIRGLRIELEEIEDHLRHHLPDSIHGVAVVAACPEDSKGSEKLIAFLEVGERGLAIQEQASIGSPDMMSFMRRVTKELEIQAKKFLPQYMLPDGYVPVSVLPMMTSGKLNRQALKTKVEQLSLKAISSFRSEDEQEMGMPESPGEVLLAHHWTYTLKMAKSKAVGLQDDFFFHGGDSLAAMRLVGAIREDGFTLTVADIFANPVLADMAKRLKPIHLNSASEPHPFELVQDKGGPTQLRQMISAQTQTDPDQVLDVYPCTDLQTAMMEDSLRYPGAQKVTFNFALPPDADLTRLHGAVSQTIEKHPVLRTRLCTIEDGIFQAVLSTSPTWQWASTLDNALQMAHHSPMSLGGTLNQLILVGRGEYLVWTLHHALYDAWSLKLIVEEVQRRYAGAEPSGNGLSRASFSHFVRYTRSDTLISAYRFWAAYLENSARVQLFNYSRIECPILDGKIYHTAPLPARLAIPGKTLASVILGAWAVVVNRLTDSNDVTLGYHLNGRTVPLRGVEACVGPTANIVPVRVAPTCADTYGKGILRIAQLVQRQLVNILPYAATGLEHIRATSADARAACNFPLYVVVHPEGSLDFTPGSDNVLSLQAASLARSGGGPLSVECELTKESVRVMVRWDTRAASEQDIHGMVGIFDGVLREADHVVTRAS